MAKKIMSLDLAATLRTLAPGESLELVVAGPDKETTYTAINAARSREGLDFQMRQHPDGMHVTVTGS